MMTTLDRITVDPEIMNGQACIRGMRLTVRRVLQAIALHPDRRDLQSEYPELEDESIGSFIRRRLGAEALEKLAEPIMAGIYVASADELSLRSTFPKKEKGG